MLCRRTALIPLTRPGRRVNQDDYPWLLSRFLMRQYILQCSHSSMWTKQYEQQKHAPGEALERLRLEDCHSASSSSTADRPPSRAVMFIVRSRTGVSAFGAKLGPLLRARAPSK
jgi:hypothetical protein